MSGRFTKAPFSPRSSAVATAVTVLVIVGLLLPSGSALGGSRPSVSATPSARIVPPSISSQSSAAAPSAGRLPSSPSVSYPPWTQVSSTQNPPGVSGGSMVYDAADGYVLQFGGQLSGGGYSAETWKFSAGQWTELTESKSPSAREYPAMTYDAKDGYVLLYGGIGSGGGDEDTWEFSGGAWSSVTTATSPGVLWGASMAYDGAADEVILFGGFESWSAFSASTWAYVGGVWTLLAPATSPGARAESGMAYDWTDAYVLLYGGIGSGVLYGDVWTFSSGDWSEETSAAPPGARQGPGLVDENATDQLLLFGGCSGANSPCNPVLQDTWEYSGGTWTNATPTVGLPPPRETLGSIAYDPALGEVVVFSGADAQGTPETDTWVWPGTIAVGITATPTSTDAGNAVSFTSTVTGGTGSYTYSWRFGDGGTSTVADPTYTYSAAGSYRVVLWVNDTASHTATASVTVSINSAPTCVASTFRSAVDVGSSVLFNGSTSGGTAPFTWAWHFGNGGTSTAQDPSHTFAVAGSYVNVLWANDSLGASSFCTATVTVNALPTVSPTATPSTTDADVATSFGATVTGGTGPFTYVWRFGDGTYADISDPTHAFPVAGTFRPWVWANDSDGGSGSSSVAVTVDPFLSAAASATPDPATVGQSVAFSETSSGGTPGYTYTWAFGDGGTAAGISVSHAYAQEGDYAVHLWVNDSVGGSALATVVVQVTTSGGGGCTAPTLLSVAVDPVQVSLGFSKSQTFTATSTDSCGDSPAHGVEYLWKLDPSSGLGSLNASLGAPVVLTSGTTAASGNLCVNATAGTTVLEACSSIAVSGSGGSGAPVILSFTANPNSIPLGSTTVIFAQATGGTGALSYAYLGLPLGCASQNSPRLNCTPTTNGTFSISLLVVDGAGHSATASTILVVTPAPTHLTTNSNSNPLPIPLDDLLLLILVGVIAVVAVVVLARRKKPPVATPYRSGPPPGWDASRFSPPPPSNVPRGPPGPSASSGRPVAVGPPPANPPQPPLQPPPNL